MAETPRPVEQRTTRAVVDLRLAAKACRIRNDPVLADRLDRFADDIKAGRVVLAFRPDEDDDG